MPHSMKHKASVYFIYAGAFCMMEIFFVHNSRKKVRIKDGYDQRVWTRYHYNRKR